MKLIKEHLGKKMKETDWTGGRYFIPLAITSLGVFVGENQNGLCDWATFVSSNWELFEEPKKRIEAAPAVGKLIDGSLYFPHRMYSSEEEALNNLGHYFFAWPAKWDATKGVWYWEE